MPQQTKTFRLFVSSTFSDMKEERRILQRDVFPRLERLCEKSKAKFQGVDLRWGVNEESQLNQKTLDICFNEITRCQKISPRPNFLILMGDKYGWQPIPFKIPEEEMDQIFPVLKVEEKDLIELWYSLDENAIPAEYVLQPRSKEIKKEDWRKAEKEIQNTLRNAVGKLNFSNEMWIKYFTSATHQEIIRGVFDPVIGSQNPEKHVFAFVGNIVDKPRGFADENFIDIVDGKPDEYSKKALLKLKADLKKKLKDNVIEYNSKCKNDTSLIDDLNAFGDNIFNVLAKIIEEETKQKVDENEINQEIALHNVFQDKLTEHFKGRDGILTTIKEYLNNPAEKRIMSLIGDSGSGKSSVMAEAIKRTENEYEDILLVNRFIGITSRSTNIISLLKSICGQISREFNETLESLAGEGREKSLNELQGLAEVFRKCLELGTNRKPVIVYLDALNQLSDSDYAKNLYWLPRELPSNARVIVSSLPELEGNLSNTCIEYLPLLPKKEASTILKQWFKAISRQLTHEQFNEIITKFTKTGLPLYLRIAFERAKQWHSYDGHIVIKDDVKGIINEYFDLLELQEHDQDFVRNAISYMLCGKYEGLAENEILEVLAFDEDYWDIFINKSHQEHKQELIDQRKLLESSMKIPIAVWSRLYLDLEPFLTEKDADGVPIITFFHQQFFKVLRERYELMEEKDKT